jgi:hypothetical protein
VGRDEGDAGGGGPRVPASFWVRSAAALSTRPSLWPTAVRQARRLARPRWWARPPFLPVPDRDYVAFRFETQYGGAGAEPEPGDLVEYLQWCRDMDRAGDAPSSRARRR